MQSQEGAISAVSAERYPEILALATIKMEEFAAEGSSGARAVKYFTPTAQTDLHLVSLSPFRALSDSWK